MNIINRTTIQTLKILNTLATGRSIHGVKNIDRLTIVQQLNITKKSSINQNIFDVTVCRRHICTNNNNWNLCGFDVMTSSIRHIKTNKDFLKTSFCCLVIKRLKLEI